MPSGSVKRVRDKGKEKKKKKKKTDTHLGKSFLDTLGTRRGGLAQLFTSILDSDLCLSQLEHLIFGL